MTAPSPAEQIRAYLEEGAALEREATPGPWKACPDETFDGEALLVCCGQGDEHAGPICAQFLTDGADARFIAAARDREPRLRRALAEVMAFVEAIPDMEWQNVAEDAADVPLRVAAILRGEPTDGR